MSREIADERISRLFELAEKRFETEPELSDLYIGLARKIGMSYNVSIPSEFERRMCSECFSFLVPGRNCRVRINSKNSTVNYKCSECGNVDRYGF